MMGQQQQGALQKELTEKTIFLGLKLWVLIGLVVGIFIVLMLGFLSLCLFCRKKWKPTSIALPCSITPDISKEIKEIKAMNSTNGIMLTVMDSPLSEAEKVLVHVEEKPYDGHVVDEEEVQISGEVCEFPHYGWGYWFTLRDLDIATQGFSKHNIIGEGGYGIVYKGQLANGVMIAVKNLLNNLGQAEREFTLEVEAIGRVRHKNLVRLLGYCVEGTYRMLVYEYIDNGNLDQWLHGQLGKMNPFPWDARMKIIIGIAKGLAYLHEALEPKVVHRDVKASNILVDKTWNAKISDFGLAKMLGSGKSHLTTRVMGTFGYVAPEYANTGLLNEKNDVYSFGVLLLETISGRDPVDYDRPPGEVNLIDWLRWMVDNNRREVVVDPNLPIKPSPLELDRALMVAFLCVDPQPTKRPPMGHVVPMLETYDFPYHYHAHKENGEVNKETKCNEDKKQEQSHPAPPASKILIENPKGEEKEDGDVVNNGVEDQGKEVNDGNRDKFKKKHTNSRPQAPVTATSSISNPQQRRDKPKSTQTSNTSRKPRKQPPPRPWV